jgi:hypothetical protein
MDRIPLPFLIMYVLSGGGLYGESRQANPVLLMALSVPLIAGYSLFLAAHGAVSAVKQGTQGMFGSVVDAAESISGTFGGIVRGAASTVGGAVQGVTGAVRGAADAVRGTVTSVSQGGSFTQAEFAAASEQVEHVLEAIPVDTIPEAQRAEFAHMNTAAVMEGVQRILRDPDLFAEVQAAYQKAQAQAQERQAQETTPNRPGRRRG